MENNKKTISKKLNQMAAILQVVEDLNQSKDCVEKEVLCATVLLKGLRLDVSALVESGE
ncbi:hypothetical protein CAG63_18335 [Vibrio sp. V37_P2S8PM304]|uniref:hypothetical protein n=1 Tax=Vibrio sp. V37_P2S8PM304 TaxID=1938688 RepID=UPI00137261BF|nr:hypothetical protein [Vibrio sp. V37_P2S8PM304]NAX32006.1 hypothetical protein [Vibrio sp. V37_P2S8PM304]